MNMLMYNGRKLPASNLKKTGQKITRMREEKGLSVRDLQVMFGFTSPQPIYSWQNGSRLPSVDNFIYLAAILGVTIDEIISTEDENAEADEVCVKCDLRSNYIN